MASYIEENAAINKLDWAMSFQRTGKFPLDRSSMFDTYADAVAYATGDGSDSRAIGGTSYIGQVITVFENDVVTVYKINADRTLGEVGKATAGDEKSIHLTDEGLAKAKSVAGRHHLFKDMLIEVFGVSEETAEEDACRIEHIVSEETVQKIKEKLEAYRSHPHPNV